MSNNQKIKIIITGGGTAGHVMPALAIIEDLKKKNVEILYIGSKTGMEKELILKQGIEYRSISTGKLRRYWSWRNIIDPFKIFWGICQSKLIIFRWKPDVVFSKGGYVGLPVIIASYILRKPIIEHESDIKLGLANRFGLRLVKKIAVSFPVEEYPNIPARKIIYTGNPLRKIISNGTREKGRALYQLTNDFPVLLIAGGSQGARNINDKIMENLVELLSRVQIIHIVGHLDFPRFKGFKEKLPAELKNNYKIYQFLEDGMSDAIAAADIVVSRAGANMIFEAAALKKPTILIPLEGHQNQNANFMVEHKAAYAIKNKDLSSKNLFEAIYYLLENNKIREQMATSANRFVTPEAAEALAEEIINLAKKK